MIKNGLITLLFIIALTACNIPVRQSVEVLPTQPAPPPTAPPPTLIPTDTPLPTPTLEPAPTVEFTNYGPVNFPADVNPLTGLKVSNPALLERYPLAVKVQVFPRGQRPPWGISLADIVYDYYQNNGLTRFHAIFLGNDAAQVGPIRSARLLDGNLVNMYKSIFAFGSADSRILNRIFSNQYANRLVLEGYSKCPPLCRVDPNGFNFLMTNTQDLSNYVPELGLVNERQNLDGMTFASTLPAGGLPVLQVIVRYSVSSYNRWDYDPVSGKYIRFQDAQESPDFATQGYEPLIDQLTGTQVTADNVVILQAANQLTPGSKLGKSEIVDINLSGTGPAYAFRDGQKFDLQWNRPENTSVLYLTFPDGTSYPYKPGNTWYQVIGESSTMEIPGDGTVKYQYGLP